VAILDEAESREKLPQLEEELRIVLEELKSIVKNTKEEKKSIKELIPQALRDELFQELKKFISLKRPIQCNSIIKTLDMYQLEDKDEEYFVKIKKLIKKYDFKETIKFIKEIEF